LVDTAVARVGLVSATSSFPAFARAGAARTDARGRPGVNPLRYLSVVDPGTADQLALLHGRLGDWVVRRGDELVIHPPGLHNSARRFRVGSGPSTVCDPDDVAGNLDALRYAASVADLVIAHLHVQAWDGADGRMRSTPAFATEFAHAAVAAGAGVVLVQGSHAPMRGIEVHDGVPILYDPGPLFRLGRRDVQPHDFYTRWGNDPDVQSFDATLLDAYTARDGAFGGGVLSPAEGNAHEPGFVLPVCELDAMTHRVRRVSLYPMRWSTARRATTGFPVLLNGPAAVEVLEHLQELSKPYGTEVLIADGVGTVVV
jgi:poly-gamma-glutamate synthesis protein (capsule biosynthesis protein)